MGKRALLNMLLATAIVIVAVMLYLDSKRQPDDIPQTFALIARPIEDLHRIEIRRAGGPVVAIERDGKRWRMRKPLHARLNEVQLGRALDVARLRVTNRLRADNLARFDLDEPWGQIKFDQNVVEFGATNQLTQELYVRSGDYVYAVPPRVAAALPGTLANWYAHELFGVDEEPIAFEFEDFSIRHDGVHWQIRPNDPALSQDDLVRWVDRWRSASSIVTQPADDAAGSGAVTVALRDGRKVVVDVVARSPNLVLRREDEKLRYQLPADLAARLMRPPNTAVPAH